MHRSGSRVRGRARGRPRVRTVVATCALVLASLGVAPAPARAPTPTPAPAPAPVATGGHRDPLAPFHAQRIRWGDCPTGYESSPCVRAYADEFLLHGRLSSGTRSCPAGE
ncbi:hypothetical protein ACH4XT_26695 [Streptomyces avidinii]|uniref:hypothetical protein n=1 Tax=Streptomyces avidinii TaxID=1895 RepID=UPI0037B5ED82